MRAVLVALAATMASAQDKIVDYEAASNVTAHNAIDRDVRDLANYAKEGGEPGWCEAYKIYKEGKNSVKGSGMRTLYGFSKTLGAGTCPETCYAHTCDYWANDIEQNDTCADLETEFWAGGCDCTGCTCHLDSDDYDIRKTAYEEYSNYHKSNTSGHDYVFNGIYKQMHDYCSANFSEFAAAPADNDRVKSEYKNASFSDVVAYQMFVKGVQYQHTWLYSTYELYSALEKCGNGENAFRPSPHFARAL
jgi:hypothetical protein